MSDYLDGISNSTRYFFLKFQNFFNQGYRQFLEHEYAQHFSEIHLDLTLEEIAKSNPEFNINFDILKERNETDSHKFYYKAGRLFAKSKTSPNINEYDKVILIGNLPVVLEIKLAKWHRSANKYKGPSNIGTKYNLNPDFYNKKLEPIRNLFGSDVGYVMIISQDYYYKRTNSRVNSIYHNFVRDGGIVMPFYTDRQSFRRDVLRIVDQYQLKLKEG